MKYIGIDYHRQYFVATTMDEKGKVIRKDKVSTDRNSIRHYFKKVVFPVPRGPRRKKLCLEVLKIVLLFPFLV